MVLKEVEGLGYVLLRVLVVVQQDPDDTLGDWGRGALAYTTRKNMSSKSGSIRFFIFIRTYVSHCSVDCSRCQKAHES